MDLFNLRDLEVFYNLPLVKYVLLMYIGAWIGGFLNVVIYRLPLMIFDDANGVEPRFNIAWPPSHCTTCKKGVPIWLNQPVVGYFITRGKCHYCKTPFSIRYAMVELLMGLLFVFAGWKLGMNYVMLIGSLFYMSYLVSIAFIDADHMIIPDSLNFQLMWLGLLFNYNGLIAGSLQNAMLGAIAGYLFPYFVYYAFKIIRKKEVTGFGDFKLFAAIGAWLGLTQVFVVIGLGNIIGLIMFCSLIVIKKKKWNDYMPFGVAISIAAIICYFFPLSIIG